MMTCAYSEVFLDDAMDNLGSAVEYAVLSAGLSGQEFLDLFVVSGIADEFGRGNVTYTSGMSGIELAKKVMTRIGKRPLPDAEPMCCDYSPEYWIGWILAYYQWQSGRSFQQIFGFLKYESIANLYRVLHEADPDKAVATFNEIKESSPRTNLAKRRTARKFSQSQLAQATGISTRSIQLYEQRQNDINHAQYNHLQALARVLNCSIDDILE